MACPVGGPSGDGAPADAHGQKEVSRRRGQPGGDRGDAGCVSRRPAPRPTSSSSGPAGRPGGGACARGGRGQGLRVEANQGGWPPAHRGAQRPALRTWRRGSRRRLCPHACTCGARGDQHHSAGPGASARERRGPGHGRYDHRRRSLGGQQCQSPAGPGAGHPAPGAAACRDQRACLAGGRRLARSLDPRRGRIDGPAPVTGGLVRRRDRPDGHRQQFLFAALHQRRGRAASRRPAPSGRRVWAIEGGTPGAPGGHGPVIGAAAVLGRRSLRSGRPQGGRSACRGRQALPGSTW